MIKFNSLYKFLLYNYESCDQIKFQNKKHLLANKKILNFIIYFFKKNNFEKCNSKLILKSFPFLILNILKYRNYFKKIKNKKYLYIILKFVLIFDGFFKIALTVISALFKKPQKPNFNPFKKNILMVGFPIHAYNISKNPESSFFSSLIEKKDDCNFFSLDTYSRDNKKIIVDRYNKINIIKKKFSLTFFIKFFFSCFKQNTKYFFNFNIPFEFKLLILETSLKQIIYQNRAKVLNNYGINFESIIFLQFNNPNYEDQNNHYEYFYADNIFLPQAYEINANENSVFKQIPFISFLCNSKTIGLNNNVDQINKFKSNKFDFFKINKQKQLNIKPCFLGFEKKFSINTSKNILIFDIPPEEKKENLRYHIFHDCISTINFSINFIEDFIELAKIKNYNFYLKPKYNIGKYNSLYRKKLNDIKLHNFHILDPYTEINIKDNDLRYVFSAPYTSVNKILNYKNLCWYYMPIEYNNFTSNPHQTVLFGLNDLNEKIK